MALNGFSDQKENFQCVKCGKEKKKSEGIFVFEGSAFCCGACCGDTEKGENQEKSGKICEFC